METPLPSIPAKRYFTIGEAADLCGVKPHVLRYWEQEFTQLRPMKRRGNRRYYQHHEVLMIRRIRDLLYDQGFTISGARIRLQELAHHGRGLASAEADPFPKLAVGHDGAAAQAATASGSHLEDRAASVELRGAAEWQSVHRELKEIRELLNWES